MAQRFPKTGRRAARRGVLTFEWILLLTLLVIGIIGGLSATRNALLHELGDLSQGVEALNACHHDNDSNPGHHDNGNHFGHQRGNGHHPHGQQPWWENTDD